MACHVEVELDAVAVVAEAEPPPRVDHVVAEEVRKCQSKIQASSGIGEVSRFVAVGQTMIDGLLERSEIAGRVPTRSNVCSLK